MGLYLLGLQHRGKSQGILSRIIFDIFKQLLHAIHWFISTHSFNSSKIEIQKELLLSFPFRRWRLWVIKFSSIISLTPRLDQETSHLTVSWSFCPHFMSLWTCYSQIRHKMHQSVIPSGLPVIPPTLDLFPYLHFFIVNFPF